MAGIVLALFLLLPSPQRLGPHELVEKVSDVYGRLNSLSADFEQIQKDRSNRTYHSRGHVFLKKGRRARFDYVNPIEKTDYFDGKIYTQYVPSQKQARAQSMGKTDDERLLIFLILGNRESPWKDEFDRMEELREPPETPGNRVIRLIPRNKTYQDVMVEVNPGNFLIHRFGFTKADGVRTEYKFTDIKTAPLDDSLFKFKAPPDVNVFMR